MSVWRNLIITVYGKLIRIKGCVGEKNYKYFLGFIFSHGLMCLYGFIVAFQVVMGIIEKNDMWNIRFRNDHTGEEFDPSIKVLFFYFLSSYNYLVFLVIICFIMALCLLLFTGYHLYMIRDGVTTAENIKISRTLNNLGVKIEEYVNMIENNPKKIDVDQYNDIKHKIDVCKNLSEQILAIYGEKNLKKHFWEVINA